MATTNMTAIPAANGFITYCLDPQEDKGKQERVQFVHSTFVDPAAELKLSRGREYDGIDFRISFSPEDRKLTEKEFKDFVEDVSKYLGDRNVIAICHNDTEHQHIHIISSFLDANGKALNFAGRRNANAEAIRRQSIVDECCKKFNLSTLPRNENSYNTREGIGGYQYKKERITKAEKQGKQPEKAELRRLINNAKDISEIEKYIVRETENSLTFLYDGKKIRVNCIDKNLKNRADLENHIKNQTKKEDGKMESKKEQLLRAERSFVQRVNAHAEDMLKYGIPREQVQSRIENILKHHTKSEDVQECWNALKQQQDELKSEKQDWYEEKQKIRQQQYEQQRAQREQEYQKRQQIQAMQRVLSSGNPIAAFAVALVYILTAIAQRHGDLNRDGITEDKQTELSKMREKEIIESFRGTLNPPDMLKKQTPEPNRMTPGR
jgi:hypothetical protein